MKVKINLIESTLEEYAELNIQKKTDAMEKTITYIEHTTLYLIATKDDRTYKINYDDVMYISVAQCLLLASVAGYLWVQLFKVKAE